MKTNRTLATFAAAVDAIIAKAQIEALTEYYKDTFLMRQTMLRTTRTADSQSADALKEAESKLGYLTQEIKETEIQIQKAVSGFNAEIAKQ